jgi:microsomal dipeptidase-like Zn-dependent dipeptidase
MNVLKKAVVLVVFALAAGGALAQGKQMTASQKEAVGQVKSMAMKERQMMMDQTKAIDTKAAEIQKSAAAMQGDNAKALQAEVADLQTHVKALQAQLAKAPKYFDDPTADPLRP